MTRCRCPAVPSLLTLYMACTPCTASTSHAPWDVDSPGPGGCLRLTGNGVLVVADLSHLWLRGTVRVEDVIEPFLGEPASQLEADHPLAESKNLAVVGKD